MTKVVSKYFAMLRRICKEKNAASFSPDRKLIRLFNTAYSLGLGLGTGSHCISLCSSASFTRVQITPGRARQGFTCWNYSAPAR